MKRNVVGAVVLLVVGVLIMTYPVIATQYNNYHQRKFAQKYVHQMGEMDESTIEKAFERAREYNEQVVGTPILDPWLLKVAADPGSKAYRDYISQLNQTDAMARLRVPDADIDLPVYHGTGDNVLQHGVGHLYGTTMPVGGENTHSVLTGHTGLATATLFDHLVDLVEGEVFYIDVLGQTLAYQIDQIKIIEPTEVSDLSRVEGGDYVTLLTCYPYAVNSHRLIVRGTRIPYDASKDNADDAWKPKMEPWMWLLIAGAGIGLASIVSIAVSRLRNKNKSDQSDEEPRRSLSGQDDQEDPEISAGDPQPKARRAELGAEDSADWRAT